MNVHIERYLLGRAEFESNINRITVDVGSFSPPPTPRSLPQFDPNHTQPSGREPLPSVEGCGLKKTRIGSLRSEDAATSAPPFSKRMWAVHRRSTKGFGTDGHEREPTKREARLRQEVQRRRRGNRRRRNGGRGRRTRGDP